MNKLSRNVAWVLVLLLLAVLPGLGLTCYLGFEQRQRAVADARGDAVHLVRLTVANHEQLIESERQWLATIAQLPEVLAGDPSACQTRLAELTRFLDAARGSRRGRRGTDSRRARSSRTDLPIA